MMGEPGKSGDLEFLPVTAERWSDFVDLFGPRGACGGCWCMWLRLKHSEYEAQKGEANRQAMRDLIESGEVPGILAYVDGEPVGWCSVAPRESFSALERSRILKTVDDQPVWSVVCFFVGKRFRRAGLSVKLLAAAAEYVKGCGGRIIEGYPTEPKKDKIADVFASIGLASAFRQAGFKEVLRRSETRPIMRKYL